MKMMTAGERRSLRGVLRRVSRDAQVLEAGLESWPEAADVKFIRNQMIALQKLVAEGRATVEEIGKRTKEAREP